ncbi:hypothetical protein GH714_003360 [Hevea brasiliensis]|uniref:AN1-type domain-containing protein n=1 Tax=Hevea brasiliensis TaxID=3981 RepID=A0A6A6KX69_HEVBR|nr:hypothetical protein GH714_003360 [Hevea brasiliensis]
MNLCFKCHKDFVLKQEQAKFDSSSSRFATKGNYNNIGNEPVVAADLQGSSAETLVSSRLASFNSITNMGGDTIMKAGPTRVLDQEMAQKTEKEETEFKVPETLTLCVNNCGVTGNPATNNMCQKCFNATTTTSTSNSTAAAPTTTTIASAPGVSSCSEILTKSPRSSKSRSPVRDPLLETNRKVDTSSDREKSDVAVANCGVNRCSGCRRKIGLTGFRCRCGELFCWEHRYSDRHDCSYDYNSRPGGDS